MTCLQVLQDMKVAGVKPNTYIYAALVVACEHNGDWEQAVRIFRKMEVRFPTSDCWHACEAHFCLYRTDRWGCVWHIGSSWRKAAEVLERAQVNRLAVPLASHASQFAAHLFCVARH